MAGHSISNRLSPVAVAASSGSPSKINSQRRSKRGQAASSVRQEVPGDGDGTSSSSSRWATSSLTLPLPPLELTLQSSPIEPEPLTASVTEIETKLDRLEVRVMSKKRGGGRSRWDTQGELPHGAAEKAAIPLPMKEVLDDIRPLVMPASTTASISPSTTPIATPSRTTTSSAKLINWADEVDEDDDALPEIDSGWSVPDPARQSAFQPSDSATPTSIPHRSPAPCASVRQATHPRIQIQSQSRYQSPNQTHSTSTDPAILFPSKSISQSKTSGPNTSIAKIKSAPSRQAPSAVFARLSGIAKPARKE
jgi:hypothetical protein